MRNKITRMIAHPLQSCLDKKPCLEIGNSLSYLKVPLRCLSVLAILSKYILFNVVVGLLFHGFK